MASDILPISGLQELDNHLDDLIGKPETPLIPKLFDDVELQLTGTFLAPHLRLRLELCLPRFPSLLFTLPNVSPELEKAANCVLTKQKQTPRQQSPSSSPSSPKS
jgi:hypothetical protein